MTPACVDIAETTATLVPRQNMHTAFQDWRSVCLWQQRVLGVCLRRTLMVWTRDR